MSTKKQPYRNYIMGFLLVVVLFCTMLEVPVYATNNTENTSEQSTQTNNKTTLTEDDGFQDYLSTKEKKNKKDNAYGSWVAGTDEYKNLYGSDYFDNTDDDNSSVSEAINWLSKAAGTFFQWEAYGINQLSSVLGLTVDNIVFGRLAEDVSISMFQFGLEYMNPFGTPGSIIYGALRDKVVLLALGIFVIVSLFVHLIFNNKDTMKQLKNGAWMLIVIILLLFIIPNLTDLFLFLRDALTALIIKAFKTTMGVSGLEFDIFNTLFNYLESDVGFTTGLILLMCSGAGLFLGWNYIKNAMIAFALYAFSPIIMLICLVNKRLLGQWATRFYGLLVIPFIDACLLMVPLFFTKMVTVKGALFVAAAMFFCIIPTRDGLLAIIGIRTERSGGMFAAMMAMRMLGSFGRGKGSVETAGAASTAGQAGRMTNTERADMLEAMGENGETAPILNPMQQNNGYGLSDGMAGGSVYDTLQEGAETVTAEPMEGAGDSPAVIGTDEIEPDSIPEGAIPDPVIANEGIGEDTVTYTGGVGTADITGESISEPGIGTADNARINGETLETGEPVLSNETTGTLSGADNAIAYNGLEAAGYDGAAYAQMAQSIEGGENSNISARAANLRMMDDTRSRMQAIQAKMDNSPSFTDEQKKAFQEFRPTAEAIGRENRSLMNKNNEYSEQIGKLKAAHEAGAITGKEYAESAGRLSEQMDKNNALIYANNEKIPAGYEAYQNSQKLERQYKQAQRDMETYTQNEREFAGKAAAMGYGDKTYTSEASYRRAQELAERKRAFVTTNNFEDPAFREVLSYKEQADLIRERERFAQKREIEKKVLGTAGALLAAPVGMAYMGIGGPESALMGAVVGGSAGSSFGKNIVPNKSAGLQEALNHQQEVRDKAIKSEEQAREKARQKAESVRLEEKTEKKKPEPERKDALQSLYDDQDKLAREGINRLDKLDE